MKDLLKKIDAHFYVLALALVFVWVAGIFFHLDNGGLGFSSVVSAVVAAFIGGIMWSNHYDQNQGR